MSGVMQRPAETFQTFIAFAHFTPPLGTQRRAPQSKLESRRNQMKTYCPQARRKGLIDSTRATRRDLLAKPLVALN